MDVLSSVINGMRTGSPMTYRFECKTPWGKRFPRIDGVSLHVVLRGSCWLTPTGGGEPLALEVGDIALLPHGHAHSMADSLDSPMDERCLNSANACPADGRAVMLPDETGGAEPTAEILTGVYPLEQAHRHPVFTSLPEAIRIPARLGLHPELRSAVDLLARELGSPRPGGHVLRSSLFDAILMYSLRAWTEGQCCPENPTSWPAVLADPVVGAALEAMHTHPERHWTVESLGATAGLSRAAFARRFTALVGQTPLAYLTWWRMALAARLLRNTDTPVARIAERAGYTSEFAFADAFKREYGTTPARYRRDTAPADQPELEPIG